MDCIIFVAKTKALISFAVTAKLICVFVCAYAKSRFSHEAVPHDLCFEQKKRKNITIFHMKIIVLQPLKVAV